MAYFDYDREYTQTELFDWVIAELAVCRANGFDSMAAMLDNYQQMINLAQSRQSDVLWVPRLPSERLTSMIKNKMMRHSKKIMYILARQESPKGNDDDDDLNTDVQFKGQADRCPECLQVKAHLKAHLMSAKHGWTEEHYNRWKGTRARSQELPQKYCRYQVEEGRMCSWKGQRLDMHLKRKHNIHPNSIVYQQLYKNSSKPHVTSTTTTNEPAITEIIQSPLSSQNSPGSDDIPIGLLCRRNKAARKRILQSDVSRCRMSHRCKSNLLSHCNIISRAKMRCQHQKYQNLLLVAVKN